MRRIKKRLKRYCDKHWNCLPWFICGIVILLKGNISRYSYGLAWATLLMMLWWYCPTENINKLSGMKKRFKNMKREEFISEMSELFQNEPDNDKYNFVIECADAYAEENAKQYYEERKERERIQWGKDICENAGESTDELPDEVFIMIADKVEGRMMSNTGDMEDEVVNEVIREYWDSKESEVEE